MSWIEECPSRHPGCVMPGGQRRLRGKTAVLLSNFSYAELRTTFAALSPLGPCWHSNSTASPSFRVR